MEWFPIVAVTFKVLVLLIGMYYAVKWHYDQGKKGKNIGKEEEKRAVLRTTALVAVGFTVLLLALGFATYFFARHLGMDLNLP